MRPYRRACEGWVAVLRTVPEVAAVLGKILIGIRAAVDWEEFWAVQQEE